MAVSPPGDIVMNVAQAADPEKVAAARARLQAYSAGKAAPASAAGSGRPGDTEVKFEAMVLQNFLQNLLPSDNEALYGEGTAGDMWRSLLTQQLSQTLAERGGFGIAERVLGDYTLEEETRVPIGAVSSSPEQQETAKQALLSSALLDEIERRAARTLAFAEAPPLNDEQR